MYQATATLNKKTISGDLTIVETTILFRARNQQISIDISEAVLSWEDDNDSPVEFRDPEETWVIIVPDRSILQESLFAPATPKRGSALPTVFIFSLLVGVLLCIITLLAQ